MSVSQQARTSFLVILIASALVGLAAAYRLLRRNAKATRALKSVNLAAIVPDGLLPER
jgi:hypothetical protein